MLKRVKDDLWEFPGGKVNEYEPCHTAAVRELLEETGLLVPSLKSIGYVEYDNTFCLVFFGLSPAWDHPKVKEPHAHSLYGFSTKFDSSQMSKRSRAILNSGIIDGVKDTLKTMRSNP